MFVAENVRGLLYAYNRESLETVISDFSALGYKVTYKLYLTADYGVAQSRERVLIVGVQDDAAPFAEPEAVTPKGSWITSRTAIQDLENAPLDSTHSHMWSLAKRSNDQGGRVLNPDKPSPTIRAECHGNNSFHYSLPRRISMREAARFQSFPDDFIFQARLRETERMIGNAVPPVFAWHVAQSIKATLEAFDVSENRLFVAAE
jgi:DNA (cytosine-5)-methyltransferase 1